MPSLRSNTSSFCDNISELTLSFYVKRFELRKDTALYKNIFLILLSILYFSLSLSMLANCMLQFLLDRLGRCLKLFVSTESISCHEFASQFGLPIFVYATNDQNYREYRVARVNIYLNEAATGHCLPVTVDRLPATTYMSGDNSDNIAVSD